MKSSIMISLIILSSFSPVLPMTEGIRYLDSCKYRNIKLIETALINQFGKGWVDNFINGDGKIYLSVTLDSLGVIVTLDRKRIDHMSNKEFNKLFDALKDKSFCLFNDDPHLSYSEFIKYGNNRYRYTFIYSKKALSSL